MNETKLVPKLRFSGFEDEWNPYSLNDLFSSVKGKGLSKEDIDENGENKCVLYGELYTTYDELIKEVVSKTDNDEGVLSKKGDILVPCSTTTKGEDLVTASVLFEDNVQLGGDISILRNKNKIPLNEMFFAYYFGSALKKDVYRLTQGSTIIHLYWKHFKKVKMNLPSIEEQNIIAQTLQTLDEKISLVKNQISEVDTYKRGLLQQMFV